MTTSTQSAFDLAKVAKLDNKQFTFFSDENVSTTTVSKSFDGLTDTLYNSSNTECWIGMDAGMGLEAVVDRIRFFPNLAWTNVARKILYA